MKRTPIVVVLCICAAALTAAALFQNSKAPRKAAGPDSRKESGTTNSGGTPGVAFALDLYAQFRHRPGNFFFSPYTISECLGMSAAGARGRTANEILSALHVGSVGELQSRSASTRDRFESSGSDIGVELNIGNGVWVQKGHAFLPAFLNICTNVYSAGLFQADFDTAPGAAIAEINSWVDRQTKGRIRAVLDGTSLPAQTRLALLSAVYFNGKWAEPFWMRATHAESFKVRPGVEKSVLIMSKEDAPKSFQDDLCRAVELDFIGKQFSMLVLLPRETYGLPRLEAALTPDYVARVVSRMAEPAERIWVSLPRFGFDWTTEMTSALNSLGIRMAFGPYADFSGIDGTRRLFTSAVLHRATIKVDEVGVESAAIDAMMSAEGILENSFIADHPFLFLIRHKASGAILFAGRFVEPPADSP